jgi:hypothetical protein
MPNECCDTRPTLVCSCFYNCPTLFLNMNPIHLKCFNQHTIQTLRLCARWISIRYHKNKRKKLVRVACSSCIVIMLSSSQASSCTNDFNYMIFKVLCGRLCPFLDHILWHNLMLMVSHIHNCDCNVEHKCFFSNSQICLPIP